MRKLFIAVAVTLASIGSATAQAPTLAGKNVNIIIGAGSGGGIDQWGRTVARHIGKHLPGNLTVVPQNMNGGGGIVAANHIYTIAPNDGTVLGLIPAGASIAPLTSVAGARFDPLKLTWIGTPTMFTDICIAMARAQVKTFQDLLANELIVGTTGVGGGPYIYPKALNGLLGTKFKLVSGFPAATNVLLAMERKRGRRRLPKR
jgi:tripartite-type tricarboxylate transporter receptor subunit TctC